MKAFIVALVLVSSSFGWAVTRSDLVSVVVNAEGDSLLADSFSKTLYVFDPDVGNPNPVCVGDCAEVWPPYIVTAEEAATLLHGPLATVERANKKLQLTYNGRPVYTYIFDRKKGDDLGDGFGGVWHYLEVEDCDGLQ